ncbi:oxidoreductase [Gayadomonas joobiniege]|uniref:oxidoreductase n=1 Tax=Gayadomonas joobiniege TaxID=1234606 RepID=UPI0003663153|nr:oxidoreductase [Gayadomonas joobiniege]
MIKTALVGFGFAAQTFHLPFIKTSHDFELVAVSSSDQNKVAAVLPTVEVYPDYQRLLQTSDAELVVITSPNDSHYAIAKSALEQGKHVLVEKPFVTRSEEGQTLIDLARQRSLILSVYQNRRYDGDFLTVKKLLSEKRLGDIKVFEAHFDRFRPQVKDRWRETASDGGGILYDLGPHLIDQALLLFGMPDAVNAEIKTLRAGGVCPDFAHISLSYPDKLVQLQASLFVASGNLRFLVQGTLGNYLKYGLDPQEDRLKAGCLPDHADWAKECPQASGSLILLNDDGELHTQVLPSELGGYQCYYQQLAAAIKDPTISPPVTAESALNNIHVIEAAIKSQKLGRRVKPNICA